MEAKIKLFAANEGGYFTAKSQAGSYYLFKIFKPSYNVRGWAIDETTRETLLSLETLLFKNFLKFCKFSGLKDFTVCSIEKVGVVRPEVKLYLTDCLQASDRATLIAFAWRNNFRLPTEVVGQRKYSYVTDSLLQQLEKCRESIRTYDFSSRSYLAIKELRQEMNRLLEEKQIVIKELK